MPARMAFMSSLMRAIEQRNVWRITTVISVHTQIASGTLEVSDNSQLGDTQVTTVQVIFTDPQQHSEMDVTTDVDTRSATTGHGQ